MKFRYKVKIKYEDIFYPELKKYKIIIQQYNPYSRLFKWDTKCDEYLEQFVFELNPDAFEDIEFTWEIKTKQVYQELQNYESMEKAIIKYIADIIIPRDKNNVKKDQQDEWIRDFVLTKNWKTIEINKEDN